jgi:hypothetical protein
MPDITNAITNMNATHRQCRDYGHAWRPRWAQWLPRKAGLEQGLECGRCGTQRWRTLTRHGDVLTSRYVYPEGYRIEGLGRLTGEDRGTLRVASVTALIGRGKR